MAQIFRPSTNVYAKLSILGGVLLVASLVGVVMGIERSPYKTREGLVYPQPVPFSHDHHTAALGIDCRYCHTTVERTAFAGIPPTETCMNCHKIIWKDSPMLEPVRASFREQKPIRWNRVHDLPDYVFFNHGVHISKGVSCVSCHGEVNKMPLIKRGSSLQMGWCLDCHRDPIDHLRPAEEVFNMDWQRPANDPEAEARLAKVEDARRLTSCSTCHH